MAAMLVFALVMGLFGVPSTNMMETNPYTVEAKSKKDKKKPVIKFSGKTKMTVEKGKSVKIPKVTAKDNKDGNVTKKITVTVKKGKKKYNSIAKAVKKNKKVKFTSTGTYKITYTVKDKAGNKATKTRTIKVVAPKSKTAAKTPTTQSPTTQAKTTERVTTETPTTQRPTTQTSTTEKVTTEQPTEERPVSEYPDLPKPVVGNGEYEVHNLKINGVDYEVVNDPDFQYRIDEASKVQDKITIEVENDYEYLMLSKDSGLIDNVEYLKFIGKITATDPYGSDVSACVAIYSPIFSDSIESKINTAYIYVEDTAGNSFAVPINLYIRTWNPDKEYDEDTIGGYELLSKNPLVYGAKRENTNTNSLGSSKEQELVKEGQMADNLHWRK